MLENMLAVALPHAVRGEPEDRAGWASVLLPWLASGGITTPRRLAAFLGQVSIESAGFTVLTENLNYSAERMCQVWPGHFSLPDGISLGIQCEHRPAVLANVVYCNRMGNGDGNTGDGWRFRGAGLIQLTGRANQTRFAAAAKVDPETVGDYLRTPRGAAQSAVWFWTTNNLNALADGWFVTAISRRINGGDEGLQTRLGLCNTIRAALGA